MSTKVYNGIKFKTKSFTELITQLGSLTEKSLEIAKNNLEDKQIKMFILLNELLNEKDSYDILRKMEQSSAKNIKKYDDININFSIFIFPHENGNIYGYFFNDLKEYQKLLFDSGICEDYHYQNQSDQSNYDESIEEWKNMSEERQNELEKDWEEREEIWEDLMGSGTFREKGLQYEIVDGNQDMWKMGIERTIDKVITDELLKKERRDKIKKLEND